MLSSWVILACLCGGNAAFSMEEWLTVVDKFKEEVKAYSDPETLQGRARDWSDAALILPPGLPAIFGKHGYLLPARNV